MELKKPALIKCLFCLLWLVIAPLQAAEFDHQHTRWNQLLQKYVIEVNNGHASQVNYAGFKQSQVELNAYLDSLSAVAKVDYEGFTKQQKMAFLINAYNAFTIKLILSKYPELKSIRDLGGFLSSPWKKTFFTLLGEQHHLDWIEHEMLRKEGVFDEARIHFAVNCASIGCPKLLNQAYKADLLDQQLTQSMQLFLQDRSRNYYDAASDTLYLSKIFDWFEKDFIRQYGSLNNFVVLNKANLLPVGTDFKSKQPNIRFTEYDWNLNDVSHASAQPDRSDRTQ